MTRALVYSCTLLVTVVAPMAAEETPPDCAQPGVSDVQLESVAETQAESKPNTINDAQLEIPFPPRIWDSFWLGWLCWNRPTAPPKQPDWFPLDAKVEQWVDDLLMEWEREGAKVNCYECTFQRWEFEPVFGPRDGRTPKTYATGTIKYQFPDKGMFRVEKLEQNVAPRKSGGKPNFVVPKNEFGEHWVCNGVSVFEFDYGQRKLIQRILPTELHGNPIADGLMPFLYACNAAAIKKRYWIRPLQPPVDVENEYWLEVWPRTASDAIACKYFIVVISQSDMRLAALSVIPRNYDAKTNPARVDYRFDNRTATSFGVNWRFWAPDFFDPKTPLGWKKEVMDLGPVKPKCKTLSN